MLLPWVLAAVVVSQSSQAAPPEAKVRAGMRGNLAAVLQLQPYLASAPAFRDAANEQAIDEALGLLERLQHTVVPTVQGPGSAALAALFAAEVTRAQAEFHTGDKDAARFRLKGLSSLCLACHSRAVVAQDAQGLGSAVERLKLDALQRAELLAMTRQFTAARKMWAEALVKKPANDVEAFEQGRALRLAVVTLVRAQEAPQELLALLTPQLARKELPAAVRVAVAQWVKDVQAWKKERAPKEETPAEQVARARSLLDRTRGATLPATDDVVLVPTMRAAALLQEALDREPRGAFRAEALLLLAIASASQHEPALWQMDGLLLETCIRENPKTAIAEQCVERLADRLYYAYTGSRGGQLPEGLAEHLGELRAVARGTGP